jgi:hypothetical protein
VLGRRAVADTSNASYGARPLRTLVASSVPSPRRRLELGDHDMTEVLPGPPPNQRSLADLEVGQEGRITGLAFEGVDASSPLQLGARVYMVESSANGWRHVRIDFREYSIPVGLAERVAVTAPEPRPPLTVDASATDLYEVLLSRRRRGSWLVRVVRRADGAVVRVRRFDTEDGARAWWEDLRADAASLDARSFQRTHRLS